MRVLLIEDDERIAADIEASLTEADFSIEWARDGAEGMERACRGDFEAIILDLMLPILGGLEVLALWRERGLRTPVLVLTARGSWIERVEGLEAGADDYLPKPFQMEELAARLRALGRRSGLRSPILKRGRLTIDTSQMRAASNGETVQLTPHEFRALTYLVDNAGHVVSSSELIAHVHGASDVVSGNAMEALIGRLRRKVGIDLIETRRGFGYLIP